MSKFSGKLKTISLTEDKDVKKKILNHFVLLIFLQLFHTENFNCSQNVIIYSYIAIEIVVAII